jgi:hypothetical protein
MPLAAIISSLWANLILVIVSLFVASFIWILTAESSSEFSLALNIGIAFTLLSQFVTLKIGALTFGLAPLLVSVVILWLLKVAFVRALRGSSITQALHLLMLSLTFAMTHSAFWWVASRLLTADIEVESGQLIVSTSLVALASSLWGMRSHTDIDEVEAQFETSIERTSRRIKERSARVILADIYATFHQDIRLGFRLGFRLVSALLIFASINFIANALLNINSVRQVAAISAHDLGSWIVLIGLTLMYVPSMLLWIYSLSLGAGFTVGTGSLINLHTQAVGPLPSLPFLGFVPYDLPDWVAISYLLAFLVSATVCFFNLRSVIVESFRRFFLALLLQVLLLNALFALIASGGVGSGRFEEVGVNLVSLLIWSALYTVLGLIGALVLISRMRGQESLEK